MVYSYFDQNNITISNRKAKKKHKCHLCGGDIEIGEVYTLMTKATWTGYRNRYKNFNVCLMHDVSNIKIKDNKLYEV